MRKIKHPTSLVLSREEIVQFQLRFTLRAFGFNDTELLVLSYIAVHGDSATEKILRDKVLGSYQTVKNYLSVLRKTGVLQGNNIHPNIKVFQEDLEYTIKLEIDDKTSKVEKVREAKSKVAESKEAESKEAESLA